MKKIVVLCFLSAVVCIFAAASFAQVPTFQKYHFQLLPDPYPLLAPNAIGLPNDALQLHLKQYEGNGYPVPAINDEVTPGIMIDGTIDPGMIFRSNAQINMDAGILFSPRYFNCDPGIILNLKKAFMPPESPDFFNPGEMNFLPTPPLSPLMNPFQKYKDLKLPQKLHIPDDDR